jgi:hypothetical protein
MECWKTKQCPKEVMERCPAYRTGNTTELRCRRFAPLERIFEAARSAGDREPAEKPVIKCFDCPVFLFRKQKTSGQSCEKIAASDGSRGIE